MKLKAPFPYFGGKSKVADIVWDRFGDVPNYVEPFAGSLAVLLGRPHEPKTETVNDKDCFISNFWRALQADPETVAHYAEWPVNENDLHARHAWLTGRRENIQSRMEGNPEYYDARAAGWWVWGISCWIGSGWCSGAGPWRVAGGELLNAGGVGQGVNRKRPHLGDAGRGVQRKLHADELMGYMGALAERLREVRVCCGDWSRVCGPSVTFIHGMTAVFLDPPYSHGLRDKSLYRVEMPIADQVRGWALENGDNPLLRLALCGYEGEHEMPGWECVPWKTAGGYGSQGNGMGRDNAARERIWFSPHCLKASQMELF